MITKKNLLKRNWKQTTGTFFDVDDRTELIAKYFHLVSLQNALAATAAPFQGQYSGFEAYPYAAAATGETRCYYFIVNVKVFKKMFRII